MVKRTQVKANKVELKKWVGNKKIYTVQKNRLHSEGELDMATISFEREIKLNKTAALRLLHEINRENKVIEMEDIDIEKKLEEGREKLRQIFKR